MLSRTGSLTERKLRAEKFRSEADCRQAITTRYRYGYYSPTYGEPLRILPLEIDYDLAAENRKRKKQRRRHIKTEFGNFELPANQLTIFDSLGCIQESQVVEG